MSGDLSVRVDSALPPLRIDHTFAGGSTTAVLGPNGAGKTTLLRLIAGLGNSSDTRITMGAAVLDDLPAHRRSVALLSQEARLFPHLSVAANVAFAPAAQRLPRREIDARVRRWLDVAEVADLADRKPHQLSGGQAQRVALARAFAAEPSVLLLDEPFRALDIDVAGRIRRLLRDVLADRARTTVLVTHDIVDVVTLADDVLVLDHGGVIDRGPMRRVVEHPANTFMARLSGLNLVAGSVDAAVVAGQTATIRSGSLVVGGVAVDALGRGRGTAVFSPDEVAVFTRPPEGSSFRNILEVGLIEVVGHGDRVLLRGHTDEAGTSEVSAQITRAALADLGIGVGDQVFFAVKASAVRVY